MAIVNDNGNGMYMPVAPAYGGGGGFGNGFGGDGWWIILLLLCGWGGMGGFGGMGGMGLGVDFPWILNGQNAINANTNNGFDHAATQAAIGNLQSAVTAGFGDVATQLCGGFAGVNATVNGAANGISQQLYSNEIASLNRSFDAQTANSQGFNALQGQLAQCCCDNRLATCQTQNLVQNEGAATRAAIQAQTQAILDKMCQDKIDEKNEKIVELQNRLNMADFAASQARQDNYLQNALTALTTVSITMTTKRLSIRKRNIQNIQTKVLSMVSPSATARWLPTICMVLSIRLLGIFSLTTEYI